MKYLVRLAPARLVRVADADWLFFASFVVTTACSVIVLVKFPLTSMDTLTVISQLSLAASVPPVKEKEVPPGSTIISPPQVPVEAWEGVAIYMPPTFCGSLLCGRLSVKLIPVNTALLGLVRRTVMVEAAPPNTVRGSKLFTTPIVRSSTTRFADADEGLVTVRPLSCRVPLTPLAAMRLVLVPVVAPRTVTLTVQIPGTDPT